MPLCQECIFFFSIPKEYDDYEEGFGDCIEEHVDSKGKWWTAKRVSGETDVSKCPKFKSK